jgi:hypothetical protein
MSLGISYTPVAGTPVYDITFTEFTDTALPRMYMAEASYENSVTGASILSGPAYRQKYMWTISCHQTPVKAQELDDMFRAWDEDRSNGYSAALGIIDRTFGAEVSSSALFSTPPSYVYISPSITLVSFGLSEV